MALAGFSFVSFARAGTPNPQPHVLRFSVAQFARRYRTKRRGAPRAGASGDVEVGPRCCRRPRQLSSSFQRSRGDRDSCAWRLCQWRVRNRLARSDLRAVTCSPTEPVSPISRQWRPPRFRGRRTEIARRERRIAQTTAGTE